MLKKNEAVMWAFTANGIVLHNTARARFIELDEVGERIWSYVDGSHSAEQILEKLRALRPELAEGTLDTVLADLEGGEFIEP
ncbi:MAG: PqqD family peptide modification chaperone [Bacteroidetes bacterium]|nr:PqqD family peptide modification chaperone [Bacteroidota bacterium]